MKIFFFMIYKWTGKHKYYLTLARFIQTILKSLFHCFSYYYYFTITHNWIFIFKELFFFFCFVNVNVLFAWFDCSLMTLEIVNMGHLTICWTTSFITLTTWPPISKADGFNGCLADNVFRLYLLKTLQCQES